MVEKRTSKIDVLLERSGQGDQAARGELLERHRGRLRKMIAVRMDRRLAKRVDPSDVVQETLLEAAGKLSDWLRERPLPIYPWLRQIAWQRMQKLSREHIQVGQRSVGREHSHITDASAQVLIDRLAASGTAPLQHVLRREMRRRVREAFEHLPEPDQEILALRFLEELSTAETAGVLEISPSAVKMRLLRALKRVRGLLADDAAENTSEKLS